MDQSCNKPIGVEGEDDRVARPRKKAKFVCKEF